MHYSSILPDVIKIADEASEKVLHIYQSDFKVNYKEDHSPTIRPWDVVPPPELTSILHRAARGRRQ